MIVVYDITIRGHTERLNTESKQSKSGVVEPLPPTQINRKGEAQMTTTKVYDYQVLTHIEQVAITYGIDSDNIRTELSENKVTIYYNQLGQGSALSQEISEMLAKFSPDTDYNIKMTPSDLKLEITLH